MQRHEVRPRRGMLSVALGLLMLVFFTIPPHAEARRATVRATGQAVVLKGNAQVAEAQAAAAAYRRALEEVARSLGGPKVGEDVLIDQLLYARAARFVTHSTLAARSLRGVMLNLDLDVEIEVDAVEAVLQSRAPLPRPRPAKDHAALHGMWVLGPQRRPEVILSAVL